MLNTLIFNKISDNIKGLAEQFAKGEISYDKMYEQTMATITETLDNSDETIKLVQDAAMKMKEESAKKGIDITESGSSQLSGALAAASQESIDLLAGQTNAVRVQQIEGINVMRDQLAELASIRVNTYNSSIRLATIGETFGRWVSSQNSSLRAQGNTSY